MPGSDYIVALNVILFEMLLMNILTNALKYNNSEKPRVDISFVADHKMLLVRFKDNGIGIERKEKKFLGNSTRAAGAVIIYRLGNSGIGLYLVQQIAKIHQGKVVADSAGMGKGSVFTLSLPFDVRGGERG